MEKSLIPATVASATQAAGGVEDPHSGRPRKHNSPRDDSPSGPAPYDRRDRVRDVPSPPQRVDDRDDQVLAPFSLGSPSLALDSQGRAIRAAETNTKQAGLDLGFIQANKLVASDTDAFGSLTLDAAPISHETQMKVQAYIQAANHLPPDVEPSRSNEAQADTPHIDHNAVAMLNKLRSDFSVTLTLIHDGDFANQLRSKDVSADPVHNHGRGEIRKNVIATMLSQWATYSTSQAWKDFAQDHGLNSDDIPALPVDIDDIDFPHLMDDEYKIVIFSLPQPDEGILRMNSALIFDFIKFAFPQPLIFHYDFQGALNEVFFLPQVTQRLGPGQIKSHRTYTTDAAGNNIALVSIPLPYFSTSPNPAAAALFNWSLQCIANDAEPLIITTPDSDTEKFTLCPDLGARGIEIKQQIRQLLISFPHSLFSDDLPWVAIPRITMQYTTRQSTIHEGAFVSLFAGKIRARSTPVSCMTCMDTCFPMHPITTVLDCPRFGRCTFCWTYEFGEVPPHKHYKACPVLHEMSAKVVEKTGLPSASVLPAPVSGPGVPVYNPYVPTSASAKRARSANKLTLQEIEQLGQPKEKKPKKSPSQMNWSLSRKKAQAALAAAKALRQQQNQPSA